MTGADLLTRNVPARNVATWCGVTPRCVRRARRGEAKALSEIKDKIIEGVSWETIETVEKEREGQKAIMDLRNRLYAANTALKKALELEAEALKAEDRAALTDMPEEQWSEIKNAATKAHGIASRALNHFQQLQGNAKRVGIWDQDSKAIQEGRKKHKSRVRSRKAAKFAVEAPSDSLLKELING